MKSNFFLPYNTLNRGLNKVGTSKLINTWEIQKDHFELTSGIFEKGTIIDILKLKNAPKNILKSIDEWICGKTWIT